MSRLTGRTALVTGGAAGLGRATAERLAREGANVVISDVQTALGKATAAECACTFLEQDVRDEARWTSIVAEIERRYGPLSIVVNNAGIVGSADAATPESTGLSEWRSVFAVNVEGVFLGCRAAVAAMRRSGGGSIINIASIAAMLATPYATAYGASKAAVRQLTKSVAQHCAEQNLDIRCNSVHPGTVRTTLWERHAQRTALARGVSLEDIVAESTALIPLRRFTHAEDVAAVVAFLASPEARHITGAKFVVDGGVLDCDTYLMRTLATQRGTPRSGETQ